MRRLASWLERRRPPMAARAAYDLWARTYGEEPNAFQRLEDRVTDAVLPDPRGLDVLDAGCGTGRWSRRLAARGAAIIAAVDFSPAMLVHHESPARRAGAAVDRLPFAAARFDLVLCALVLGHLERLGPPLAELARVTRPGGVLVVSDFHPAAAARGWRRTFTFRRRGRPRARAIEHYAHPIDDYRRRLESAGLRVEALEEVAWQGVPVVFALRAVRS